MLTATYSRLKTLNLFPSSTTTNNAYELHNERLSTRFYIPILFFSLLIITIYTAQVSIRHTIEVKTPKFDHFQSLSRQFSETLHCPCRNVAMPYESFIALKPQFHQLCTSDFIQPKWIDYIGSEADTYVSDDFSYTGALIFRMLASFCRSANQTTANEIVKFFSARFITSEALLEKRFEEQIQQILRNFRLSVELNYYQLLVLIRDSTRVNQIMSTLFSDQTFSMSRATNRLIFNSRPYENGTCHCNIFRYCSDPIILRDRRINQTILSSPYRIPGLFKSCSLGDTVLQSSLDCFYQASCIETIAQFLQTPLTTGDPIRPLSASDHIRFSRSSTIDELLRSVMVEQWSETVSYPQYFDQCEVALCSYYLASRLNLVYITSILTGLIGGLIKILRLIIPPVVKFIRRRLVTTEISVTESSKKIVTSEQTYSLLMLIESGVGLK